MGDIVKGIKQIDFDFDITYSKGGRFVTTRQITVRAPGLNRFEVHAAMTAYVNKAALAFTEIAGKLQGSAPAQPEAPTQPPETASEDDQDVIQLMAMGLGIEKFPEFVVYVKRVLTNSPRLATAGESGDQALTDEVWESLEANGGMEAVHRVMSEFTGFFFEAMGKRQAKQSGVASAPTSASPTKGPSPIARRPSSRLSS